MPYEMSKQRLRGLVESAFRDPELNTRLDEIADETGSPRDDLKQRMINRFMAEIDESTAWRAAGEVIPQIRDLEAEIKNVEGAALPSPAFTEPGYMALLLRLLVYEGIAAVTAILVILVYGFSDGWSLTLSAVGSFPWLLATGGVVLVATIILYRAALNRVNSEQERIRKLQEDVSAQFARKVADLNKKIKERKDEADAAVIESGIKTVLREFIGRYRPRSYDLVLEMLTHSGLAEVRNEKYDIPTESYAQLNQLVRNMHGGSIGLAGPRGSGKTTLMYSISKIQKLDKSNSRVLAVMTSAPVTYDTRDFIILIFKLLCTEYQSRIGEPEPGPYREMEQELKPSRSKLTGILWEILRPFHPKLRRYVLVLGIVLVALSFSLAVSKSAQSPAAAVTPAAPTATASGAQSAAPTGSSAAITMTLEEVGITAASLFRWGGILILATLAIGAIRVRLWKGESIEDRVTGLTMERPISHEELEGEMRRWAAEEGIPWPEVQERLEAWYRKARITRRGVERRYDRFSSDPGVLARTWLRDLRFQQSYASGWSGSLHLPLGIETGVENTMQLAQYQLSLPEIIAGYQHFVKALRADYTVIIGIDELDKLGSAEEAYKFLNGIKALFGIDDCFYLISVSENAMSSFERRGLPIRDAFDSSFDKIVYVDYLDYAVAERLINRRVIGIPVPFIAFCYCMSGGLPRDLIRCCRLMFEKLAEKPKQTSPQKTPLNEIVNAIIETDLRLKLQAVAIAAKQSQAIDEVNKLLEGIYRFERLLLRSPQWPFESYNYFQNYTRNSVPANPNEKPDEEKRKILLLILELDTYLYYVATLHEYFSNLDIKRLQEDEKGELDTLARARQLFAYSIAESRRVIEEFRQSHNMDLRSVSGNGNRDASTGPRKKGKPEGT